MAKKIKILLVEDDKKFAESLVRILNNEGFECVHAEKPQTAISLCKLQQFDIAIVDCMLPQMNGVDLGLKLKEITGSSITLYLMSGIYKDRNFSVSAIKKTSAKSFLIKPFEIESLLNILKESHSPQSAEPVAKDISIKGLFFQDSISAAQIYAGLEHTPNITCVEAPLILSSLISNKITCKIHLSFDKEMFQIYFHEGKMFLDQPIISPAQLRSYLSRKDYVIQDDLQSLPDVVFTIRSLQERNHISPHFTDLIEKDVALQSLAKLKQNQNLQIKHSAEPPPKNALELTANETDDLIYDWVASTPLIWFKAFYMKYMTFAFKKMSTHQTKTSFFPIVAANKHVVSLMLENKSLAEIQHESKVDEDTFFKLTHLLLVYREFFMSEKKQATNNAAQMERLKSLLSTIEHQDAYERLGLQHLASDQDIKKSYTDLSQSLHPDKLVDAPPELIELSKQVYEKIQESYNQIKSPDKREQYKRFIESQKKEKHSTSIRLLDQAFNVMVRGDITAAESLLQQAENFAPHSQRLKVLQAWVHIKTKKHPIQQISRTLQTLSQEERDTATYHFVRGLLAAATNELDKATTHYNHALSKDSDFMPARRELLAMPKATKKSGSVFTGDLKDVVGLFFKKK